MYRVFVHFPAFTACDYYRAILPVLKCKEELESSRGVELVGAQNINTKDDFDCYVFHRLINPSYYPFIYDLKFNRGKKIVWDFDDDLFRVPVWSPASEMSGGFARESLATCLNWADRITVTTERMRRQTCPPETGWHEKSVALPNLANELDWSHEVEPSRRVGGPVRVLWAGSLTHEKDLAVAEAAVDRIVEEFRYKVEIIFMCMMPQRFMQSTVEKVVKYKKIVKFMPPVDLTYYPDVLNSLAPDVALLPLCDEPFNNSKSNIKYIEMTLAGAACVASRVGPYGEIGSQCVLHADDDDAWYAGLRDLIVSRELREAVHANARKDVEENYLWSSKSSRIWIDFFGSLAG